MTQTLSVDLPSGTVYVSGTVNGVAKTWTNTEGNTWETVADTAADEKYLVELVLISSTGITSEEKFTLYYGILNLITDRTQADLNRAKQLAAIGYANMTDAEKAEWDGNLKGAYNANDMNRVESAVLYLVGVLKELPQELRDYAAELGVSFDRFFDVPYYADGLNLTVKNTWQVGEIPSREEKSRYLSNVVELRRTIDYETDDLPGSMDGLTVGGANAIEKALLLLESAIDKFRQNKQTQLENTAAAWFFAGEIYTNEV